MSGRFVTLVCPLSPDFGCLAMSSHRRVPDPRYEKGWPQSARRFQLQGDGDLCIYNTLLVSLSEFRASKITNCLVQVVENLS